MGRNAANGLLVLLMGSVLFAQDSDGGKLTLAASEQMALTNKPVTTVLQINRDMKSKVAQAAESARVYLVVRRPTADRPPGVTYDVFVNLPPGKKGAEMTPYLVGTINFFEIRAKSFVSFDITDRIRGILSAGGSVNVTLIPDGEPAPDTHPRLQRLELVLLPKKS
jgi:hypothetical protein